jgi:uroporphyrinogen-III synthase
MTEPLDVVSFESRRSDEMARLLERHGARVTRAPSMREVPLSEQPEALSFGEKLLAGECDFLILLTGVGLRALLSALETRWPRERVLEALKSVPIACRGPKPVAVLKELGMRPLVVAPEPNTTRELIEALAPHALEDKRVYVQEYGRQNAELRAALELRDAHVYSVAVYAWQLPEDIAPLQAAIAALCSGVPDAVVFTSAQQILHVLEVAEQSGQADALLRSLRGHVVVASIGPVTSDALRERGIPVDVEPEHPKMGHLTKALLEHGPAALARKRANSQS